MTHMLNNNPNLLTGPVHAVSQFLHDKAGKFFVAEISELDDTAAGLDGRIYADAADAGFTLHNVETGGYATFVFDHTDRIDGGEDVAGWVYVPTRETLRLHPQLAGYTVTIIND
jgi:hypothetical protein